MAIRKTEKDGVSVFVGDSVKYKKSPRAKAVLATVLDIQDVQAGALNISVSGEVIKNVTDKWSPVTD